MAQKLETVTRNGIEYVNTHPAAIALGHLNALKEGVLIVRLQTNRKKVDAIEHLIENAEKGSKEVFRLREMLEIEKVGQAEYERNLLQATNLLYSYSDVAFMYDYHTKEYLNGQLLLFDAERNAVSQDHVKGKPVYILSGGTSNYNQSRVWELLDANLKEIPPPFPGVVSLNFFQKIFSSFGSDTFFNNRMSTFQRELEKGEIKLAAKSARGLNEKFLIPMSEYHSGDN